MLAQRSRGRVQGVHMGVHLAVFGKHFERILVIFRSMLVSLESIVSRCLWYLGPCWCFWEICLHSIQRSRVCCSVSLLLFSFSFPSPFPFSFLFLFVSLSLFFSCMFSCIMLCLFIFYSCPVLCFSFLWKGAQETPKRYIKWTKNKYIGPRMLQEWPEEVMRDHFGVIWEHVERILL